MFECLSVSVECLSEKTHRVESQERRRVSRRRIDSAEVALCDKPDIISLIHRDGEQDGVAAGEPSRAFNGLRESSEYQSVITVQRQYSFKQMVTGAADPLCFDQGAGHNSQSRDRTNSADPERKGKPKIFQYAPDR